MRIFLMWALLVCGSPVAWSWGEIGHRTICAVAEKRFDSKTKKTIARISKNVPFPKLCTVMDELRSHPNKQKYDKYLPWHYIEIPEGQNLQTVSRSVLGDALSAMQAQEKILKDPKSSDEAKYESLIILIHVLSDIHQPLHIGNGLDRGANHCRVKFFGQEMPLHVLWDSGLIDHMKLSYTELALFIDHADKQTERNLSKGTFEDWIMESMSFRDKPYPVAVDAKGNKVEGRPYCSLDKRLNSMPGAKLKVKNIPELSWDYVFEHKPLVETQLLKAGLRLGRVLNEM